MKCPKCGGPFFGTATCVSCKEPFVMRRREQVTCGSARCQRERGLVRQRAHTKINGIRTKGAERFPGEFVICKICGSKVQKTRVDQSTCYSKECLRKHRDLKKWRGVKADHVRDMG